MMRLAITFPYSIRRVTGIGAVVQTISRTLRGNGDAVDWIVPDGLEEVFFAPPDGTELVEVGVETYRHGRDVILSLGTLRALWALAPHLDLIHAHQPHLQTLAAMFVARVRRIPIVVTFHGRLPRPYTRLPRAFLRFLEAATFRWADRVVLVSEASKAEFGDAWGVVIHNGVRPALPSPDDPNSREVRKAWNADGQTVLMYAGRFATLKGVFELLEATRALLTQGRRVHLVLIGGGLPEEEARLRDRIRDLGLEESTTVYGALQEYRAYLACADVYVFPSHLEGLPLTVLEAMAAGLPVVATDVGGIPEIVRDGREGKLIPPRDARALTEAVAWMMDHPEERRGMGSAGRKRVATAFSEDRMTSAYLRLYGELCAESARP